MMFTKTNKIIHCILLRAFVLVAMICLYSYPSYAEWWNQTFDEMNSSIGCLDAPSFDNTFTSGSVSVNITQNPVWQSTGLNVQEGKIFKIRYDLNNIIPASREYLVMYRIDPRFSNPQVFIIEKTLDDQGNVKYVSQTMTNLNNIQSCINSALNPTTPQGSIGDCVSQYDNMYADQISVAAGETVEILLTDAAEFLNALQTMNFSSPGMSGGQDIIPYQDHTQGVFSIYTETGIADNRIIHTSGTNFCTALFGSLTVPTYDLSLYSCTNGIYVNKSDFVDRLMGISDTPMILQKLSDCTHDQITAGNVACMYKDGYGMNISLDGTVIKHSRDSFIDWSENSTSFYYYSGGSGNLTFSSDWSVTTFPNVGVTNMFNSLPSGGQSVNQWTATTAEGVTDSLANVGSNFIYFGRYIMKVRISSIIPQDSQTHHLEPRYIISPTDPGNSEGTGLVSSATTHTEFTTNADTSGILWLQLTSADVSGVLNVDYSADTAKTFISETVSNYIINPIKEQVKQFTVILYSGLVNPEGLSVPIIRTLLTLYVMLYALYFLAGATQIKVVDLVTRIVKIGVITALFFSQNSWHFFNDYLFDAFVKGSDYMISNIAGADTVAGNFWGFLDVIFNKYTQWSLLRALLIQLLQIGSGMTFFTMLVMYGMFLFLLSMVEVVTGYLMAFICINIMVSLAPIFITFCLFERTKHLFNNWISTLFNCLLQPTILLIFFLLIDQIMMAQFSHVALKSCWGILIPFNLYIGVPFLGIPNMTIPIPFFPGIPFYIPQLGSGGVLGISGSYLGFVAASLIFFCYALMARGLLGYVTSLVRTLTSISGVAGGEAAASVAKEFKAGVAGTAKLGAEVSVGVVRKAGSTAFNAGKDIYSGRAKSAAGEVVKDIKESAKTIPGHLKKTAQDIKEVASKIYNTASKVVDAVRKGRASNTTNANSSDEQSSHKEEESGKSAPTQTAAKKEEPGERAPTQTAAKEEESGKRAPTQEEEPGEAIKSAPGRAVDTVSDAASRAKASAGRKLDRAKEAVKSAPGRAKKAVSETAGDVKRAAKEVKDSAVRGAKEINKALDDAVDQVDSYLDSRSKKPEDKAKPKDKK